MKTMILAFALFTAAAFGQERYIQSLTPERLTMPDGRSVAILTGDCFPLVRIEFLIRWMVAIW